VALDPRNGNVMALVGGFSRELGEFDRATQAKRQPGSSFKSFVYLTALTIGYDPTSALLDVPFAAEQGPGQPDWRPGSYGGARGLGLISMSRALEMSKNLASIRLLYEIGTGPVGSLVRQLGMDVSDLPLSAGLGAIETTPIAMAAAYAAMANGGHAVRPRFVSSISGQGVPREIVLGGLGPQVVTAVESAMMQNMLRTVVAGEHGTARSAFRNFPGWVAGKTGTTNDSKDAWFVAAMPEIAIAVWIGRDDSKPLPGHLTGGAAAAPIVRDFLEAMGTRLKLEPPDLPAGARMIKVDPSSGRPSDAKNALQVVVRAGAATPVVTPPGGGAESRAITDEEEEP
jgi:penicillin-binding protein 1A